MIRWADDPPPPTSPKYDELTTECASYIFIVVFGGGARRAEGVLHDAQTNYCSHCIDYCYGLLNSMPHSVFISYSRHESPFVDALLDTLEDEGIKVWVDYQNLVPGRPWLDQILEGIREADVFLLVVSKGSMVSPNVELEYKQALEQNKRIILILFELTNLPVSVQACEWIDFRGSFRKRKNDLLARLDQAIQGTPPPEKGFKTSFTVWLTAFASLLILVVSIPGWWTFFLPGLLIPLPLRILRRDLNFYRVRFAVLALPLILFLSWMFFQTYPTLETLFPVAFLISMFLSPIFLFLLSSNGMRIWGKPSASAPRFANQYVPDGTRPTPVPFYIEHAPADRKYAEAIAQGLTKYGHPHVADPAEAKASFVLLSRYKNSTALDLEQNVVYPILIQDTQIEDQKIQKIQWIDFRRGIRNLDRMAELLDEPQKLLKALGVAPISGQIVYPRIIQMLDYFLVLLAFFTVSAWIPFMLELGRPLLRLENRFSFIVANLIFSVLTLGIIFLIRRALVQREGWLASLGWLALSLSCIAVIVCSQSFQIIANIDPLTALAGPVAATANDMRGSVSTFLPCSCTLGVMLLSFFAFWNWQDLTRWFPAK